MKYLLFILLPIIIGCACPCNQAQLDAATSSIINIQMERTVNTMVPNDVTP